MFFFYHTNLSPCFFFSLKYSRMYLSFPNAASPFVYIQNNFDHRITLQHDTKCLGTITPQNSFLGGSRNRITLFTNGTFAIQDWASLQSLVVSDDDLKVPRCPSINEGIALSFLGGIFNGRVFSHTFFELPFINSSRSLPLSYQNYITMQLCFLTKDNVM